MSNHNHHHHRYYSHEDVPRVYSSDNTRSLDCSEHSAAISGISSLYFDCEYPGSEHSLDTTNKGRIHATCGDSSGGRNAKGGNKLGESGVYIGKGGTSSGSSYDNYNSKGNAFFDSDRALHGSGVSHGKRGSSGGSSYDNCNSKGNTLFDSDRALHGSGVSHGKRGTSVGSSYGFYNNGTNTLFDSNQAVCGPSFVSSGAGVGFNGYHGNSNYQQRSSDYSSFGLSRSETSNQFPTSNASNSRARNRTNTLSQIAEGTTVYDVGRRTQPYQIEFRVENKGKQISASKRTLHFRFGFANSSAMSTGKIGDDCRGVEHHLCIIWSITGSKRSILMDGAEVMHSAGKRANGSRRADILEASWDMSNHSYELMCHAYKPTNRPFENRDSQWKQYNLIIDGRSYFDLPQISDLCMSATYTNEKNTSVNMSDLSITGGSRSISATSQCTGMKSELEVKRITQARIAEQRQVLNARRHSVTSQSRRARSTDEDSLHSGVVSAAPSELTDSTIPNAASPHRNSKELEYQSSLSRIIMGSPKQEHNQMQSVQSQQQSHALTKTQPSQQRRLVEAQLPHNLHSDRLGQLQLRSSQTRINPSTTRQYVPSKHLITYTPQQPPSYEQITCSILGAYDTSALGYTTSEHLSSVIVKGSEGNQSIASDAISLSEINNSSGTIPLAP